MTNSTRRSASRTRARRCPAALIAGALLASACAGANDWVQTYPDVAARARQDPQAFVADVNGRWDEMRSMVGSYQVRASRGINSRTIDTQIYLLRDRFVEIQVLAPTGASEGYLVAGSDEVGFWASDEGRLYKGPNIDGAFARALGIDLSPEAIVAVLLGFGVEVVAGEATIEWDEAARRIRVTAAGTSAWLHPVLGHYDRVLVGTPAGPIEITYEAWSQQGPPVPLRMTIDVAAEDISLRLRLAPNWQANPAGLGVDYFEVLSVAGAVEAPLSLLQAEGGLLRRGLER